jgi:glycosyltransferase involved in cell wall biosynthesis
MHILEVYLESGGYDYNLIKGGISVYMWNLSKAFVGKGHQVSLITAMHGKHDYLREHYELEELTYCRNWSLKLALDPAIWGDQSTVDVPLITKAYRMHKEGVDIYLLSNEYLDMYPDTFYPPYSSKGKDIGFYKSLIFQMETVFFIRDYFNDPTMLVHAHEPYYQYLLPCSLAQDGYRVVSTVQSNMPINKKVYKPKVASLLAQLGVQLDLNQFDDLVSKNDFNRCLFDYLPRTHLNYSYPADYINLYALILAYSHKVDFLSEGHLEFYQTFKGTAFRALYNQLRIKQLVDEKCDRFFVGGCALSDSWLSKDFTLLKASKDETLRSLGLTPGLPSFYHNARYAPNHKGQVELVHAIEQLLDQGGQANFILRCVSGDGIPDSRFHALQARYPAYVALIWQYQSEEKLMAMAAAADFSLFPSKFEMDTFLIAQGESMLAGCVPIASAQLGMKHWNHCEQWTNNEKLVTGFSVVRSFLEEDPQLVRDLTEKISAAIDLYNCKPEVYQTLSQKAIQHARGFTWEQVADLHLENFSDVLSVPNSTGLTCVDALDQYVDELGELISVRAHSENEELIAQLPPLIMGEEIRYCHQQAQAIDFFIVEKQGVVRESMSSLEGEFRFTTGREVEHCLLLVTLNNGVQYWDGVLPAPSVH